jgi:hypothetical protein
MMCNEFNQINYSGSYENNEQSSLLCPIDMLHVTDLDLGPFLFFLFILGFLAIRTQVA